MTSVIDINVWRRDLDTDNRGSYKANLANIPIVLRTSPEFKYKLGFNTLLSTHTNTAKNRESGRTRCIPATWACFCIRPKADSCGPLYTWTEIVP